LHGVCNETSDHCDCDTGWLGSSCDILDDFTNASKQLQ
jgi:hypothetical protein